jgi:hypothetical protein
MITAVVRMITATIVRVIIEGIIEGAAVSGAACHAREAGET